MKTHSGGTGLRRVVIVCLAALFALLAMGVTLMGTGVYRSVADDADTNSTQRIALSYVVNQIRRLDAGGVAVGTFGGGDALRLTETSEDGSVYVTLIYCFEGSLMELYMEEGTGLAPEDGMELLELSSLDLSVSETGGLDITEKGFYYSSTNSSPTAADNQAVSAASGNTLTATLTGVLDDRQVRILSDIKPFIYIEVGIRTQRVTTEPRLLNRSLTVRVTQTNRISCLLATTSYRYLVILNHTGLFNQIQPIGTFSCLFLRIAILQHLIVSGTRPSIGSVILIRSFPSINATKLLNNLLFRQTCRLDRIRHSQMTCSIRAN